MASPLVPCPSCARHVRAGETACPFCAAALPDDLGTQAVPAAPRRLGRAAAFVFGATLSVTACTAEVITTPAGDAGAHDSGPDDDGGTNAPDGMPGLDAGPGDDGGPADDGGGMALYGDPPPPDDAGPDAGDDGGWQQPYGTPPPPPQEQG